MALQTGSTAALAAALAVCAAGCAGRAGGGSMAAPLPQFVPPPPPPPAPPPPEPPLPPSNFTSWASGGTFSPVGHSLDAIYQDAPSPLQRGATLTGTFSPAGVTDLGITSGGREVADPKFGSETSPTADPRLGVIGTSWWEARVGHLANSYVLDWNYQTFGVWRSSHKVGYHPGDHLRHLMGALTVGAQTGVPDIPVTGTAAYSGFAAGNYFTSAHNVSDDFSATYNVATASVSANVDFAKRSILLSLTDSILLGTFRDGTTGPNPNLNLSGTLTYVAGANGFSGSVATIGGAEANAPMTGTAQGFFYGPGAAELGGVFWVSGAGGLAYGGGFGAKK